MVQPFGAVYYRRIDVPIDALKSALLYWDVVYRIVPARPKPSDSPELKALIDNGLVRNVAPSQDARDSAERRFRLRVREWLAMRKDPPPGMGSDVADYWRYFGGDASWRFGDPMVDVEARDWLHIQKLNYSLQRDLERLYRGFARGSSMSLPERLVDLYLLALGMAIGDEFQGAILHEKEDDEILGLMFQLGAAGRASDGSQPDGQACARLCLSWPSAEQLKALTITEFISLRNALEDARRSFRATLQRRMNDLSTLTSVDAYREHVRQLASEVEAEVREHERLLARQRVTALNGLLSLSAPAAIPALLNAAHAPPWATAIGGTFGLALSVTNWFAKYSEGQRQAGHYLLALGKRVPDRAAAVFDQSIQDVLLG